MKIVLYIYLFFVSFLLGAWLMVLVASFDTEYSYSKPYTAPVAGLECESNCRYYDDMVRSLQSL